MGRSWVYFLQKQQRNKKRKDDPKEKLKPKEVYSEYMDNSESEKENEVEDEIVDIAEMTVDEYKK